MNLKEGSSRQETGTRWIKVFLLVDVKAGMRWVSADYVLERKTKRNASRFPMTWNAGDAEAWFRHYVA